MGNKELIKEATEEVLLENTSMNEIIENYGMEIAQEVGENLTIAYNYLVENNII